MPTVGLLLNPDNFRLDFPCLKISKKNFPNPYTSKFLPDSNYFHKIDLNNFHKNVLFKLFPQNVVLF